MIEDSVLIQECAKNMQNLFLSILLVFKCKFWLQNHSLPNPFQFRQAVQAESVTHETCYFLKEIREPVFYRFDKEPFFFEVMNI